MEKERKQDRENLWVPEENSTGAQLGKRRWQKKRLRCPFTYFTVQPKGWHCHIIDRTITQSSNIIELLHLSSDPLHCLWSDGDWFLNPESGVLAICEVSSCPGQLLSPLQSVDSHQSLQDPVGRPIMHLSGLKHATGEAVFCDDIPMVDRELFMVLVTSTRAHAKIM